MIDKNVNFYQDFRGAEEKWTVSDEPEAFQKERKQTGQPKKNAANLATANLLTIEEASAFLNLKVSKLRSMVFRSEIPFIKIGRLVRFHAQDLDVWVATQRFVPPEIRSTKQAGRNKPEPYAILQRTSVL